MGRNLLEISIIVLSLLVASTVAAEELIQNGGFESGVLSPWEEVGDHDAWSVADSYAYDGAFSALVRGPYPIAQAFEPTPGVDIEAFSLAVMTGMPGWIHVEVGYDDLLEPTRTSLFVSAAMQWQVFDLLEYIDPDRDVYRVVLRGHQNGDAPDDMRTFYDTITLQAVGSHDDPVADPEADEILEATTKRVRVKFNTKRSRTRVAVALKADELPEGIHEGPVEIKVLLSQDGFTTSFEGVAELVDVPHRKDHIIRLMDEASAEKVKSRQ